MENESKKPFKTEDQLPDDIEKAKEKMKNEFAKRVEAASVNTAETTLGKSLKLEKENPAYLRCEEQNVAFVRFANRKQNPPSDRPAFMICSTFVDVEEADAHFEQYKEAYLSGGALWKCETGLFVPCCISLELQCNSEYTTKKKEELVRIHQETLQINRKEFQTNVQEKKMGETGQSDLRKKERLKEKQAVRTAAIKDLSKKKFQKEGRRMAGSLDNQARKYDQRWAVVSFLCDNTPEVMAGEADPEPLLRIYGCFSTPEDANEAKLEVADRMDNYDIDIVATGEWLFPEDVNIEKLKHEYRNSQQNEIMNARKEKKKELEVYEKWCHDENIELPETIIDEDGNVEKRKVDLIKSIIINGEDCMHEKDTSIEELQKKLDEERERLKKAKGENRKEIKTKISEIGEKTRMVIEQKKNVKELLRIKKAELAEKEKQLKAAEDLESKKVVVPELPVVVENVVVTEPIENVEPVQPFVK